VDVLQIAVGVEFEVGGEIQRIHGKRITLCAGAFGSPAILMRSGVGPRQQLERHGIRTLVDAPGMGANLIDHPLVLMLAPLSSDAIRQSGGTDHSRNSVLLRYTAPGSGEFNDMQLYFLPLVDLTMLAGFPFPPRTPPALIMLPVLQRPRSRGVLRLRSANPHDQPDIKLNYLDDPEDLRRMIEGVRLAWRIMHEAEIAAGWQSPIASVAGQLLDQATVDSDAAIADFIRNECNTICHPVGTAGMGSDPDHGAVVDQHCRVYGVEGLRVVDASVMPNIVRANTNLTCIMIGERVADWMRAQV
jgi:choline dehydrogenase